MAPLVKRITEGEDFAEVRTLSQHGHEDLARAALARRVGLSQAAAVFEALATLRRAAGQVSAPHKAIRAEWEGRMLKYIGRAYPRAMDAAREAIRG